MMDVVASGIVKDEILLPQTGTSLILKKGHLLEVIDLEGQQVADLFCFPLEDLRDPLSSGRSIDYNETIRFTKGHVLYSSQGRRLARIVEDSCGQHDFLVSPCSLQMFQMLDPHCKDHPSCLENLHKAFFPMGIDPRLIGTTFNIFMNFKHLEDGAIQLEAPKSYSGSNFVIEALTDLAVGLTACADEATNNGRCKAIGYRIISLK